MAAPTAPDFAPPNGKKSASYRARFHPLHPAPNRNHLTT